MSQNRSGVETWHGRVPAPKRIGREVRMGEKVVSCGSDARQATDRVVILACGGTIQEAETATPGCRLAVRHRLPALPRADGVVARSDTQAAPL